MPDIDGEPAFPIYDVRFHWHIPIGDRDITGMGPPWFEGLPAGRMKSGSQMDFMCREEMPVEEVVRQLTEVNLPRFQEKEPGLGDFQVSVKPARFEVWNLTWFCHQTYDRGQSDADVLASFNRFVMRRQRVEGSCLMGAEDRWRWHGEKQGDLPPCRCQGCRKCGMIRIGH